VEVAHCVWGDFPGLVYQGGAFREACGNDPRTLQHAVPVLLGLRGIPELLRSHVPLSFSVIDTAVELRPNAGPQADLPLGGF